MADITHRYTISDARRLEVLHQAALAITAELSLETVLQRIVDSARELARASYGALGVADESGRILQFITSGITPQARAALGDPPQGHGLLGALIKERIVLRVPNIAKDPRSHGFPPNHPRMTNLLGVPLIFQGRVVGNLYLTNKRGAPDFDDDDVQLISMLAAQAAVAIANAQLYEEMQRQYQIAEARRIQLQTIVNRIPLAVVISNETGRRALINDAGREMFGDLVSDTDQNVFPYTNVEGFYHPDGARYQRGQLPLDVALREGQILHDREIVLRRPDGSRRTILSNTAPLEDAQGRRAGAVGVFRDITAVKEADQLKDDFLSLVSHELRTPLTTIHGGARTLRRHVAGMPMETIEGLLDDIAGESERLVRLVNNMLDLSRIRVGRLALETEPCRLGPVIRHGYQAAAAALADRVVTLRIDEGLPLVDCDADRIEQVMRNLLENAGKYVPPGGQVTISAYAEDGYVRTTVADNGPGIAPDQVAHIFERFYRVDEGGGTARGAGLGLYLARHLIEAHGGRLWVESQVGQGSAFSFTLPISREV